MIFFKYQGDSEGYVRIWDISGYCDHKHILDANKTCDWTVSTID